MTTKEEFSEKISDVIGLSLDWAKMSKTDIERLFEFVNDPGNLVKAGLRNMRSHVRREYLEKPLEAILKDLQERPIVTFAKEKGGDKGLFGFGILTGKRLKIFKGENR